MAATPPMPPGSNSYPLNGSSSFNPAEGNTRGRSSSNNISEAINQHFLRKKEAPPTSQRSHCASYEQLELLEHPQPAAAAEAAAAAARPEAEAARKQNTHCHCTNISIMHLFHEMKQEFPTIPDAIVTQCVSENCHQRENCIQMLKKELALHPIPVQSYPAKVLQQQQQRQAKPPTPLKPSRVAPTQPPVPSLNGNGNGNGNDDASPSPTHSPSPQPRPRPTTLNLQRQLNAQLQQKIHQRQQRQQRDNQPPQLTPTSLNKPLRRAPALPPPPGPPLAPKPSFSNDSSCLTSPMSSSESEFSLNAVSLSSPTSATRAAAAATATATATTPQQASPVRHRSVINLQPELPYARDFLSNSSALSPALTPPTLPGSPGSASAVSPGRKSFTSLNLTLRQPTGGAQSAIDITAGPAPSGQGSGITYSSVSFDARRGTHKNFQLTVTDEGSVFSAGCIRPQAPYAACEPQQQTAVPPPRQPPPPPAASLLSTDGLSPSDCDMPEVFPYPTQAQNHVVASNYNTNHAADTSSGNNNNGSSSNDSSPVSMPLYAGVLEECDPEARAATIERQKQRRDKLANVLRDNKKRLLVLEQEINILTEPVPVGESERLDRDIKKLTEDCQRLLNLINEPQANGSGPAPNSMNRQHSAPANNIQQQIQQQQQPQPFPRQRPSGRSQAPPSSLRLHSVPAQPTAQPGPDFVQHHSSAPTSACLTPQQQLQLQQEPPPTYAQYYQFQQYLQQQRQQQLQQFQLQQQQAQQQQQQQQQMPAQRPANDEEEYLSDSDVDEDEEPLDMWACNMCTFRNHPQLNICEACENVRIQPGPVLSREDIHITLSPGENRIIHSWILS
ncbi:mediator of RNA polymerase II transcription subunit 15 isoform X2 [Drosophila obscura]|uniref:mediator of RNA polymerase II transcription subunit 15 isoform X2 n=1 Tax=Drosophila obscura TaxID=7282 RepID=UPI001BB119C9|nr:mediator of RNA polymerase II transcription subunit 15 isoform X2 [Drosophila obscura]